jgi:hypothetical protein
MHTKASEGDMSLHISIKGQLPHITSLKTRDLEPTLSLKRDKSLSFLFEGGHVELHLSVMENIWSPSF